jgi:CheY-like chemotaxis protein
LSVLEKTDIDVVVLDVMMPGRDGISTLKEFKSNPSVIRGKITKNAMIS